MSRRLPERLRALGALGALVAIVAGPPLVLARLGRPWPTRWPSLSEFGDAVRSTDLPTGPVLKGRGPGRVGAWAVVVAGVAVEIAARLRGGAHLRRRSPSGPLQPLVAHLVATVMLLAPVVRPTSAAAHPQPIPVTARPAVTAPAPNSPVDGVTSALEAWRAGAAEVDLAAVEAAGYRVHVVARWESLARIAREQLNDEDRWPELWALNRGSRQGDGRFTDLSLIYKGWRSICCGLPSAGGRQQVSHLRDGADRETGHQSWIHLALQVPKPPEVTAVPGHVRSARRPARYPAK